MKRKHPTTNIQPSTSNEQSAAWAIHDGEAAARKYDLEERLLEFASAIIDLSEKLPADFTLGNFTVSEPW